MAVLPANRKVDLNLLREAAEADEAKLPTRRSFGSASRLRDGAMPPFGNLYGMEVFVSEQLAEDDHIAFNAGTHTEVMRLRTPTSPGCETEGGEVHGLSAGDREASQCSSNRTAARPRPQHGREAQPTTRFTSFSHDDDLLHRLARRKGCAFPAFMAGFNLRLGWRWRRA